MVQGKTPISLLMNTETVELIVEYYKKDCPNKELSLSRWVQALIQESLTERRLLDD